MKFWVGVTDGKWYRYLSSINPEDVNFWQPGGNSSFNVLEPKAPFLFKLRYPDNAIVGIGFFSSHTFLPMNIAWDVFGDRNGCSTFSEFQNMILQYRADKINPNPTIGCIVLTNPVFFKREDWIMAPENWSKSIVQGKSYDMNDSIGQELWSRVEGLLQNYLPPILQDQQTESVFWEGEPLYRTNVLSRVRVGQGAFRVLVTDAYTRKCSITGEKTLPVLEAAHIKPYALAGPHAISNGLLLRSDVHKLFDTGYLTINDNYKVEVSKRIKEEFENGKEYYQFHGKELLYIPKEEKEKPRIQFIQWHNENIYKG